MNKQAIKAALIVKGIIGVRACNNPKDASVYADNFAANAQATYPILSEQDEIDISDAIWSASSTVKSATIMLDFA